MFSPARLSAITRKELRHITRDARIFFLVTLSPAFILLVLSYLFSFDIGTVRLAWLDQDHSALSRAYLAEMTADGSNEVSAWATNPADADYAIYAGTADIAVTIPTCFEAAYQRWRATLGQTRGPQILGVADGADAISATQALGNLGRQTAAFGAGLAREAVPAAAGNGDAVAARIWFNSALKSAWGMVPGLLAIALTLPALALTLAVTRESEVGTLEALVASPVSGGEYLLGKVLAYVLSGTVSLVLGVAVAVLWFGVPFRGSPALLVLLTVDFYLATMGIALLISRLVGSQQTAMLVVLLVFFVPGFFLSGLILPVNTSSLRAALLSYSLPTTHFVAITRGIFLKGATLTDLALPASLLLLTALLSLGLSLLTFKKQVA